jgi:hypothetical protein
MILTVEARPSGQDGNDADFEIMIQVDGRAVRLIRLPKFDTREGWQGLLHAISYIATEEVNRP